MKKSIIVTAGLAFGALALLAGCKDQGNSATNVPAQPKWKGAPYHITFDTAATKPNASGVTIPVIKYEANPDAVEKRACLVVRFDTAGAKTDQQVMDQMIMGAVDISGTEGSLPADYMDIADKGLARMFAAYGMKGKIKANVALARSSLTSQAGDSEINEKLLSDWLPTEIDFKKGH